MKVTFSLSAIWLLIASFFTPTGTETLVGNISDGTEPLIGATVKVLRGTDAVRGTITDFNGDYRITLEPGTYDLEFSYTGFQTQKITGVKVFAGKITTQNVVMSKAKVLDVMEISTHRVPLIEQDNTSGGQTLTSDQIKNLPTRDVKAVKEKKSSPPAMAKPGGPAEDADLSIRGRRSESSEYYIDGIRVKSEPAELGALRDGPAPKPAKPTPEIINLADDDTSSPGLLRQPAPRAGLLTAGEWNDLHNWDRHWVDLIADGETDTYQNMYTFYPRQRYTLILTNENGFPLADAPVRMLDAEKLVWEARTDNTGKAELWAAMFNPQDTAANLRAEVQVNGQPQELSALKKAAEGFNYLKINAECKSPNKVDIVWAVDATGSMGDEIEYLKTELLDVIVRAKSHNPTLDYRMGAVFYRDKGDEYVTKSSPLSPDIAQTVGFIQQQRAAGGGDYPEAVHSALEAVMFDQQWSENAIARICFLVLDASPHQGADINASLQKSIREAARLGIRIVPIAASGIQKDTEFLMKFFGLATNGSYVFLTDHSGIGGKHLEPTTDEYKVEPLNDLLVRLITEYSAVETCEGKSEIRFVGDPQQQPGPIMQALYYPNPTAEQFTLELPFTVQSVTIYNSEGKAVRKLENPVEGQNVVMVNDLAAGFYTIRILNNGLMQSGKLMVVRS